MLCTCVFSQGFTGKPGMEGPQGPVGMYVSDSTAGHIQGMHLYYLFHSTELALVNFGYVHPFTHRAAACTGP